MKQAAALDIWHSLPASKLKRLKKQKTANKVTI